jgi:hypothetical protein
VLLKRENKQALTSSCPGSAAFNPSQIASILNYDKFFFYYCTIFIKRINSYKGRSQAQKHMVIMLRRKKMKSWKLHSILYSHFSVDLSQTLSSCVCGAKFLQLFSFFCSSYIKKKINGR